MNPIIQNVLAVIAGFFGGSLINGGLVKLGHILFPLPEGTDTSTMEGLTAAMPNFGPEQFILPFFAHALGTMAGAFLAGVIAANNKMKFAMGIGVLFLLAGIYMTTVLPAPVWFEALDVIAAYLPAAWLGGKLAERRNAAA